MKDPRPDSETTEMIETKKVKIGKVPEPPPVRELRPTPLAGEVWYVRFPGEIELSTCQVLTVRSLRARQLDVHRAGWHCVSYTHRKGPCRVRQFPPGCGKGPRLLTRVKLGGSVAWLCRECLGRLRGTAT